MQLFDVISIIINIICFDLYFDKKVVPKFRQDLNYIEKQIDFLLNHNVYNIGLCVCLLTGTQIFYHQHKCGCISLMHH